MLKEDEYLSFSVFSEKRKDGIHSELEMRINYYTKLFHFFGGRDNYVILIAGRRTKTVTK